jgi:hypothetical protein
MFSACGSGQLTRAVIELPEPQRCTRQQNGDLDMPGVVRLERRTGQCPDTAYFWRNDSFRAIVPSRDSVEVLMARLQANGLSRPNRCDGATDAAATDGVLQRQVGGL